jgi:hypothetical protein
MDAIIIIAAFFFALVMCLGLILVKWIIMQLGVTTFFLIVFLAGAISILAAKDGEEDDE